MSKNLPALKPREIIRILERIGFIFHRQEGSHRIYIKENQYTVVPYHNKDLKKGTLFQIIKATGLSTEEFIQYL